jgi:signal transduction histidine kinase
MGTLMRSFEWGATVFGPVGQWPQSLRTAVSIMLESRFAMVVAWGPEFRFFYNDRYRPILGSTKHPAAVARPAAEIFPEVWGVIGPEFERVRRGESFAIDDWLLPLDRNGYLENCWFTLSYSPIRDESGGVGGLLAVVAETTGRVEGERRLATLRDLARRAADATTAEAACADAAAVLEQNPTDVPFALIYLLEPDGTQARRVARAGIPSDHPAAAEKVELGVGEETHTWPLARVVRAREMVVLEDLPARFGPLPGGACPEETQSAVLLPLVRPGQERPYGMLVAGLSPRRALDDRYRGFFELAADHLATAISNAHSLEEARHRAEALAEIDRAKTAFFSNVSHEFRTPLTLLLGPTEDALASPDHALRGEALESVHRNALRLLKLVNALLDFSRLEAGRVEAVYEPVDLRALTRDLASGFRSAIERAGLTLSFQSDELTEPAFVDRGMWEKIVLNLLSNALKFTFQGGITVTLRQAADHYELAVGDTGVGIPEHELANVFQRFRRVEGVRARTHEGSGIGLALVQELVRMHGGETSVTSVVGQGSTFSVSIPRGSAHLAAERIRAAGDTHPALPSIRAFVEEALRWTDGQGVGHVEAPPGASRILVADDNADMRAYLGRILGERWAVETHADGVSALAAARARLPDLVLSDVMMPGLDGFGLLKALRAEESTRHVPVVLLSARAGEEARIEGLERGADDYLVKPFSARELVARIGSQLTLSAARREAELQTQQMDRLRGEAESASRAKDEFLAMLSHELRNPLSPILTALQLMRLREGADAVERERVIIERQVRHLTRLVDDLLDVSRVAQGKIELRRHPLELAEVVAKGVELASPLFEERHHELTLTVPPTGLLVDADEQRLTQVVANLLTNAAKYTDARGRIDVVARAEGEEVVLSVRDNGIGMPAALVPDVFDLFVQGPRALDRSHGGLGLGLAIVRSLVTLHGGSVAAASDGPGRGSRFTVRLPLSKAARPRAAAGESSLPKGEGGRARSRVLVVDDNPDAADALAEALRIGGYEVRTANDGVQALAIAASFRPEVALLDLGLPVMDGYELGERLREAPETRGLSLVALTGYGHAAHRARSRAAGFDEHLVKPVDIASIHQLLRRLDASKPDRASS